MIYYFTPFAIDKDLGKAYNDYCKIVPNDDDWICFIDADAMFLTPDVGNQINHIVEKMKIDDRIGMFTTYASRIGNKQQRFNGIISEDPNILNHRKIALRQRDLYYEKVQQLHKIISGHFMLFPKRVWKDVGGFKEDMGILAVDNWFSKRILRAGYKIYLMQGIYVLHFYRLDTGKGDKSHLL